MALQATIQLKRLIDVQAAMAEIANIDGIARVRQVFPDEADEELRRMLVVDLEPGYDDPEKDADPDYLSKGFIYRITDLEIAEYVETAPHRTAKYRAKTGT